MNPNEHILKQIIGGVIFRPAHYKPYYSVSANEVVHGVQLALLPRCQHRDDKRRQMTEEEEKLFGLAKKVAETFELYQVFRGDMVYGWQQGRENHWQAMLWQRPFSWD